MCTTIFSDVTLWSMANQICTDISEECHNSIISQKTVIFKHHTAPKWMWNTWLCQRSLTCIADGGEPMSNDEYSTPSHDVFQGLLNKMLTLCIQCTVAYKAHCNVSAQLASYYHLSAVTDSCNSPCCLIQQEDSGILKQRHRKLPSSQSCELKFYTTDTLQHLHSYLWFGQSKAIMHCR